MSHLQLILFLFAYFMFGDASKTVISYFGDSNVGYNDSFRLIRGISLLPFQLMSQTYWVLVYGALLWEYNNHYRFFCYANVHW